MYSKLLAGERIGKTLFTIPDTNLTCMKGKLRTALDSTQEAVYLPWTPPPTMLCNNNTNHSTNHCVDLKEIYSKKSSWAMN